MEAVSSKNTVKSYQAIRSPSIIKIAAKPRLQMFTEAKRTFA